ISNDTKKKLEQFWAPFHYLIIDECSMISQSFLAELEKNISIGKKNAINGCTFGGLNILLCGDFHQFPPVVAPKDGLYMPAAPGVDSILQCTGRILYEEFSTIVILQEQMRVVDPEWREMLTRLRHGNVQKKDIDLLRGMIITDTTAGQWEKACLATPQHGVQRAWNEAALQKHCEVTGGQVFICHAEDRVKDHELNLAEEYGLALRS
ncbi:hypothetical protein F5050DRAFT_1549469, partial [Lentinula boryana]